MNEYEKAPDRMIRIAATEDMLFGGPTGSGKNMLSVPAAIVWPFKGRVETALHGAGLPEAEMGWDDEDDVSTCTRSGYSFWNEERRNGRVVYIAVLGRTGVPDEVRQGERDALMQQARAALVSAGMEVQVNEYGHLRAVDR